MHPDAVLKVRVDLHTIRAGCRGRTMGSSLGALSGSDCCFCKKNAGLVLLVALAQAMRSQWSRGFGAWAGSGGEKRS